jgi:hypothetical protein
VKFDNLLLLVTTAPSYMKNAAGLLVSYPQVIHVMCTVHALHTVCEKINTFDPNAEKLMANGKKISAKSSAERQISKNKVPGSEDLKDLRVTGPMC